MNLTETHDATKHERGIAVNTAYRWSSCVESAELDQTWVIMNVERYTITSLSPVGDFVWSKLHEPTSKDELIDNLLSEYDVTRGQAEIDVDQFLTQLISNGLVDQFNVL